MEQSIHSSAHFAALLKEKKRVQGPLRPPSQLQHAQDPSRAELQAEKKHEKITQNKT
jgi:hypothetical protein